MYIEVWPSAHLARSVECYWTIDGESAGGHAVLPDGCVDVVFIWHQGRLREARVVGAMTRPRLVRFSDGDARLGLRFRPGMASSWLAVPVSSLTDRVMPLADVWRSGAAPLIDAVSRARSVEERLASLAKHLGGSPEPTTVQRALHELNASQGQIALDELADRARLSDRQFRRLCLEHVGLSPKRLSRILRFRRVVDRLHAGNGGPLSALALDCGYYDQAHFIRDFQEFSGTAPSRYGPGVDRGRFVQDGLGMPATY